MSNNNKTWIILLSILATILVIVEFYFLITIYTNVKDIKKNLQQIEQSITQNKTQSKSDEKGNDSTADDKQKDDSPESEQTDTANSKDSAYRTYTNDKIGITFSYPKKWGKISEKISNTKDHISLSLPKLGSGTIFLGADNGGQSAARGGYFGDTAEQISDQKFIDNLCNKNQGNYTTSFQKNYLDDFISCKLKTNPQGVKYAKVKKEIMKFGPSTIGFNYHIYNPNTQYRGIILSTDRLKQAGVQDPEVKLDKIMQSFKFN